MIILGHPLIPFKPLYKVTNIDQINETTPNATVLFDFFNEELLKYVTSEGLSFALRVKSIKEACLSNALKADFIVVDETIASEIQTIANEYLFDTKVLLHVNKDNQIENAAKNSIDGVIFSEGIV